ncbi:MAG: hypothetical protein PSX81_04890 [bacterium]|nr:hypothetical protein [bacterium]
MLKILFNLFIIYAIWQLLKMIFTVKKVSNDFQRNMNAMHEKMNNQEPTKPSNDKNKPSNNEGEYIDYEEIK